MMSEKTTPTEFAHLQVRYRAVASNLLRAEERICELEKQLTAEKDCVAGVCKQRDELRVFNSTLEAGGDSLRHMLARAKREADECGVRCGRLRVELESVKEEGHDLEVELQRKEAECVMLRARCQQLEDEHVAESKKVIEEQKTKINDLEARYSDLLVERSTLTNKLVRDRACLEAVNREKKALAQQLVNVQKELGGQINRLSQNLSTLEQELRRAYGRADELSDHLSDKKRMYADLQDRVRELEKESTARANIDRSVEQLRREKHDMAADLDFERNAVGDLQGRVVELERELNKRSNNEPLVEQLRQENVELTHRLEALKSELSAGDDAVLRRIVARVAQSKQDAEKEGRAYDAMASIYEDVLRIIRSETGELETT